MIINLCIGCITQSVTSEYSKVSKMIIITQVMHKCIINECRKQHIYRVALLLKEYPFIYLPHIEGLEGNLTDEYHTETFLILDTYFSK